MSVMTTSRRPFGLPGMRRITVDEYERIIASGSIDDPEEIELIDGYMVRRRERAPVCAGRAGNSERPSVVPSLMESRDRWSGRGVGFGGRRVRP